MKFIEEIVVEEFLPTFRSMLAEALREEGLTQSEVADHLGISQSAVSKYVHGAVERNEAILESEQLRDHVDQLATGLAAGDLTPVQALVETEILIRELEQGGLLADLHAEAVPALADHDQAFAVHDPESRLRQAEQVRSSVRRGLRILENTGGVSQHIPAVGSNLVECLPEAESIEDVAGVPGRILDVKGRPTIPAAPEFGVSQHVANVLLATRAGGSDARAAANLAYDPDLLADLEGAGHTTVEFDAGADVATGIAAALDASPGADVLYQTGAHGVEPIIYVLGPDAPTVAAAVRDVA